MNPMNAVEDHWEEHEIDDDAICLACKEHCGISVLKHKITGEIDEDDAVSSCCGSGYWSP